MVADGFIAAAGEDRGQADQTCAVPLADTGGMDTHAAAFGGYGVPDFRPTGADGEGETGASAKSAGKVGRVKGGHMEVIEKMQLGRFEELKPGEGDI